VVLLLFAVPFLIRNLLLPMVGDDFSYAFIWNGDDLGNLMDDIGPRERIHSFYDILVSQWSHYFTWGGRTPSMIIIQLFAWLGKIWFDLANTIVFTLLMLILYWLSVGNTVSPARHKGVFFWVMAGILFGVIDYVSTMLWMTGACVYLWSGFWECLFLLPFVTRKHPPMLLMAPLGLLAGWSEEAGSLVTVMLTAWLMFVFWRQKQLEKWMVVGSCFLLIGCGLLMLCPGSLHRESIMLEYAPEYVLPAEDLFSARMFWDNFTGGFLPILIWESFLLIPVILYCVSRSVECGVWSENSSAAESFHDSNLTPHSTLHTPRIKLFTAGGLLVLCVMMFAPEFELRTGFHSTLFLTIGSAAALKEIAPWLKQALVATPWRRAITLATASILVAYSLFVLAGSLVVESSFRRQFDERLSYVRQHQDADSLVVPYYKIPYNLDRYLGPRSITDFHIIYAGDLESKTTDNRSLMYARYYGFPPIRIDREIDWNKRNED
jgi:hypothetical protein